MTSESPTPSTRDNLIAAGLHLFGRDGFAATSTRQLAAMAETNVASIAYHFGSKAGLHAACAQAVASKIAGIVGSPHPPGALSADAAAERIETAIRRLVTFLVQAPGADDMVAFVLREIDAPGEVAETIYAGFIEPKHRELCALWAAATGRDAESETVRLTVFSMIGQAVYFRVGRPFVLRRMGWADVGEDEARMIADTLAANLRAAIRRDRT